MGGLLSNVSSLQIVQKRESTKIGLSEIAKFFVTQRSLAMEFHGKLGTLENVLILLEQSLSSTIEGFDRDLL